MSEFRDQYCVRLGPRPDRAQRGYVVWRLSRRELGRLLRNWKATSWRQVSTGRSPSEGRFHPTARRRLRSPNPLRAAVKDIERCNRALYHGVGRDQPGLALLERACKRVVAYDPYHPDALVRRKPRGKFDEIVSVYSLNVMSPTEGKRALREIFAKLRPRGHATIAVRSDVCSW